MIDLFTFSIIGIVYIMVMHFAVGIKGEFNLFIMIGLFIIGAAMGAYMNSYEFGLGAAIILTLIFI